MELPIDRPDGLKRPDPPSSWYINPAAILFHVRL